MLRSRVAVVPLFLFLFLLLFTAMATGTVGARPAGAQELPPELEVPPRDAFLIPAGVVSDLPLVRANDNRTPAGVERDGVRKISLEIVQADWRVESPAGPGLRIAAVAEAGQAPTIPAPLIRVDEGTTLRIRVRNTLSGDTVTVSGLHGRPSEADESFTLAPGQATTVEFSAGPPGTYLYHLRPGPPQPILPNGFPFRERDQAAGAFVVDPRGGSPPDRVVVINIVSQLVGDREDPGYVEGVAMNGLSWPYTERFNLQVGETQRWRIVNASRRFHPMHLHGFFYSVLARGTMSADTLYAPESRRSVVTEPMKPGTTMLMEWTPHREGRWLFHCHLSFHVAAHIRLPGAREADPEHAHSHMAGLVMGIEVEPGPTDLIARGDPVSLDLYVGEQDEGAGHRYQFSLNPERDPEGPGQVPGPPLIFHQFQAVDVTVHNRMSIPTGVHWHGLELDAWADGVPGWSASAGRVSPVIEPGASFTYRLSTMRPGTFIYHSHLDDIDQLTGGLYGPLIVLPEGETFDPRTDHVRTVGWNTPEPLGPEHLDVNGGQDQPAQEAVVGETHRFRLINIAPAGQVNAWIVKEGEEAPVPITLHAKDGAELPEHQQVPVDVLPRMGVGETADFLWTPTEPGSYELHIGPSPRSFSVQRWVVAEGG